MHKKRVPELRFPGFSDEWEQRKLGDITDRASEKNINLSEKETFTNSAELGIISQQDYFDHGITNEANIGGYYIVHPDDFVYNPRISSSAPVGPINRNKLGRNGVMSPLYTVFHAHDIDNAFLEYYFKTSKWHQFMYFNGDSGARSDRFSIKANLFYEMPIAMPSSHEQHKIGLFFSMLDKEIAIHQRKEGLLRELKKGMLQKVFSREIRFKDADGQDFPDWEEKRLGECFEVSGGHTPSMDNPAFWENGTVNWLSSKDIKTDRIYRSGVQITEAGSASLKKYQPGTLVLVVRSGILKHSLPIAMLQCESTVNQDIKALEVKKDDPSFIFYLIQSMEEDILHRYVKTGTTVQSINLPDLYKCKVLLPSSMEEQKQIAGYFSRLDARIATEQQSVSSLQEMKKGFLQKMFA